MESTIKQRIEQINNGQVPEGYKKTDFGVFPNDWVTDKKLKDIGSFDKGRGLPGDKMCDSGVPCVGYGDIYMKYNDFHFEKAENFVDEDTASESLPIEKGALLFTGTGETAEEIGKCVCYNGDETIYAGGDIITFKTNEVNPLFLAYQQYQPYSLAKKASFGQGHSVVHIQKNNLEKLNVAYPQSATEQEKIAEILMKWDEAIGLQEKYIEKLKVKKNAIMHKLLVPKPNWKTIKLGDICKIKTGKLNVNDSCETGKYPFFSCSKDVYSIDNFSFDCEALLIAGNGDIGDIKYYKGKFDAYQRTYVLTDFSFDIQYVMQYLIFHFDKEVLKGIQKSSMPYIKLISLKTATIKYDENNYIQVQKYLFEFEKSIALSKTKLENLRLQRKALQQYLLNGIVRVEV